MIHKILTTYTARLDEYLFAFHHQPEGMATVKPIGNTAEEQPNKLVVCLLNVEREKKATLRFRRSNLRYLTAVLKSTEDFIFFNIGQSMSFNTKINKVKRII